jgi:hypothetical protein
MFATRALGAARGLTYDLPIVLVVEGSADGLKARRAWTAEGLGDGGDAETSGRLERCAQ